MGKKELSGPVIVITIAVFVVLALGAGLWYVNKPPAIGPEAQKMMDAHRRSLQQNQGAPTQSYPATGQ